MNGIAYIEQGDLLRHAYAIRMTEPDAYAWDERATREAEAAQVAFWQVEPYAEHAEPQYGVWGQHLAR